MYLGDPLGDKPLLFMTFQLCFGQYLGQNCGGRVHILTAEMPLTSKTSIHGVTKNKVQLNKMLAGAMMDPEFYRHATAGQMHSLSVAGTEDVPVEIVGATVIERRDLSSSHD